MTYSVYLTHAWSVWIALGSRRTLIDISPRALVVLCGGVLLSAFTIAFIFTFLFESPLFHILDSIKGRSKSLPELPVLESELMEPTKLAIESVHVFQNGNGTNLVNNNEEEGKNPQENPLALAAQLRGWKYTAP